MQHHVDVDITNSESIALKTWFISCRTHLIELIGVSVNIWLIPMNMTNTLQHL